MANRLAMDKTQGIMQLFASGMSERQIARTLDIDRKSVDRELRAQGAKGASSAKAPTGCELENRTIIESLKSLLDGSGIFYARMERILH